jgi:hypothetical protein
MGQWAVSAVAAASVLSIGVTWSRYTSQIYPYSISQPSSYRHVELQNNVGRKVDYFSPSLGSFITCVVVYAVRGTRFQNEISILEGLGGRDVRRAGSLTVNGHQYPIIRADFSGLTAHWTEEHVTFVRKGLVWHLHMSYDRRYRSQRAMMFRMLKSFKPAN